MGIIKLDFGNMYFLPLGFSPEEEEKIKESMNRISETYDGSPLFAQGQGVSIVLRPVSPSNNVPGNWIPEGDYVGENGQTVHMKDTIYITKDPDKYKFINQYGELSSVTLDRILAHELFHSTNISGTNALSAPFYDPFAEFMNDDDEIDYNKAKSAFIEKDYNYIGPELRELR